MPIRRYRDFVVVCDDIQFDSNKRVSQFTVHVFDSPGGQGNCKEVVTVPDMLIKECELLGSPTRVLDNQPARLASLGATLTELLLPRKHARRLFDRCWPPHVEDEGLRLRLRLPESLADFPWEYLYLAPDGANYDPTKYDARHFLALDRRFSVVRHTALPVPADWFAVPARRRVIVAMATPQPHDDYPELVSLPTEQLAIKASLEKVPGLEAVYLPDYPVGVAAGGVTGATVKSLMGALEKDADVLHFSGHGVFATDDPGPAFGRTAGGGGLILADAGNQALPVSAGEFAQLLRDRGVRLVVLGACESARQDSKNVWSGVAGALLEAEIPAVVAMQFGVIDSLTAAFSEGFYRGLVAGLLVDEAVALGRAAMRQQAQTGPKPHNRDWGAAVLYLRAAEGAVFPPVSDEPIRHQAEAGLARLVLQKVDVVAEGASMIGAVTPYPVKVHQVVREVRDLLVGKVTFGGERGGGVVQELGTVTGPVIGWIDTAKPKEETDVVTLLERLLRLKKA